MSKEKPGLVTIAAGALASGAAFFVLTRLGLFGTVTGAVIASVIYIAASHWIGQGFELGRGVLGPLMRRLRPALLAPEAPLGAEAVEAEAEAGGAVSGPEAVEPAEIDSEAGADTGTPELSPRRAGAARLVPWRRRALRWAPAALSALALLVSVYTVSAGGPLQRVVVREVVREQPVVEERVVVERETVTPTVPVEILVPSSDAPSGSAAIPNPSPSRGAERSTPPAVPTATTSTTAPSSTTTTTSAPPVGATPSTAPAPAPETTTTTAPAPAAAAPPSTSP
jgi:hypothetical protein